MTDSVKIRPSAPGDREAVIQVYPAAFPEEDLTPLVSGLLDDGAVLSLVAEVDGSLAGHVVFSDCNANGAPVALLGPLAVAPDWQRKGVGSALVREGLARVEAEGAAGVLVLGDPAYYRRFGFEAGHGVGAPHPLPPEWGEAWRLLRFGEFDPAGVLAVPAPWRPRALWA